MKELDRSAHSALYVMLEKQGVDDIMLYVAPQETLSGLGIDSAVSFSRNGDKAYGYISQEFMRSPGSYAELTQGMTSYEYITNQVVNAYNAPPIHVQEPLDRDAHSQLYAAATAFVLRHDREERERYERAGETPPDSPSTFSLIIDRDPSRHNVWVTENREDRHITITFSETIFHGREASTVDGVEHPRFAALSSAEIIAIIGHEFGHAAYNHIGSVGLRANIVYGLAKDVSDYYGSENITEEEIEALITSYGPAIDEVVAARRRVNELLADEWSVLAGVDRADLSSALDKIYDKDPNYMHRPTAQQTHPAFEDRYNALFDIDTALTQLENFINAQYNTMTLPDGRPLYAIDMKEIAGQSLDMSPARFASDAVDSAPGDLSAPPSFSSMPPLEHNCGREH